MTKNKRIFIQKKTHAYILPGIYGVGYTYTYGMTPILKGLNFGSTLVLMKEGVMHWYAFEHKFEEVAKGALKLAKKDPDYVFMIRKKFERLVPQVTEFTGQVFKKDLSQLSNRQLWQIIEKYLKLYNKIYPWGEPITLGLEDSLGSYLKDYLKSKLNKSNLKSLTENYNILVSPKEKSFVRREADDLLKVVSQIQSHHRQKQFFIKEKVSEKKLKEKFPQLYAKIKKHKESYCWVPYDYGVYLWEMEYFLKVIKDLVKTRKAKAELVKSRSYYQALVKKQQQLVKELKIDSYHQKLFKVLRTCAYIQDFKKEHFTKSHYEIMPVIREVAKRFKVTEVQARFYAPDELKKALLDNKLISQLRLELRYNYSVQYWYQDRFKVYEGQEAKKIFNKEAKKVAVRDITSLTGVIASAGKYVGRVRVILLPKELKEFRAGEILVAQMTSLDYVLAMKKAGAIITDRGGVTCHAAVVSRELGVPCVVGTQNATKVLKTGELVEVNANHNSVKILKK